MPNTKLVKARVPKKIMNDDIIISQIEITENSSVSELNFDKSIFNIKTKSKVLEELEVQNTELNRTTIELDNLQAKYKSLYEFIPVGHIVIDETNRIVEINSTASELLKLPKQKLYNRSFSKFVHTEDQAKYNLYLFNTSNATIMPPCELRLDLENTSTLTVMLSGSLTKNPSHLQLAILDISEKKVVELALHESEERHRSIVESSTEWIWEINTKGKYTYSNNSVYFILGFDAKNIISKTRTSFIHSEERTAAKKHFLNALTNKTGWANLINRYINKEGICHYLESNAYPLFDSAGNITGFRGTDRDITLRKQAEDKKAISYMEKLLSFKRQSYYNLAGALTHELSQPITAIKNYIDCGLKELTKNYPEQSAVFELLKSASLQAERACEIFHRVKDMDDARNTFTETDVEQMIEEVACLLKHQFNEQELQINFKNRSTSSLIIDKIKIQQVLINIIRNAIEAMLDASISPQVTIEISNAKNYSIFTISNSGPQISQETARKLFELGYTTKSKGFGLGLAISKAFVKAHNGELYIKNVPSGACFEFVLPIIKGDS